MNGILSDMIERDRYLKKLKGFKDKQLIKVITGIRRCGKSTLLDMFRTYLMHNGVHPDRITSINFEDMENAHLCEPKTLHAFIVKRLHPGLMNYVFLDEVQMVADFPRVVDGLYIRKNVDVYITGSNAFLLSSEIATMLSGRYVEIRMLPLSLSEYISSTGETDLNRTYAEFLRHGSFPYIRNLDGDPEKIRDYLGGIYHTVLLKDVASRNRIADIMMLESVVRFIFHNIANLFSTKKIADTMTSAGRKISTHTVESYLTALENSFILYRAKRYDVKGKQYLKTLDKYYIVDIGLRNYLLGSRDADVGHILENIVYLELLRRDYRVYVGKVGPHEVDFIAMKQEIIEYYQVAASVRHEGTLERELMPLNSVTDHYPKFLLTLDNDPPADYNGIRRINALDFLLS